MPVNDVELHVPWMNYCKITAKEHTTLPASTGGLSCCKPVLLADCTDVSLSRSQNGATARSMMKIGNQRHAYSRRANKCVATGLPATASLLQSEVNFLTVIMEALEDAVTQCAFCSHIANVSFSGSVTRVFVVIERQQADFTKALRSTRQLSVLFGIT
ncbi:hypothetical protein, conserved [Eimeria necatrix]|uniref:Uncharacterized protein n=1 Tax=Eimeria necatrix TaxID=51315 RepID=U6N806_9EIME|nr:hypothetical protein, conserved [Eimeria necatrix]CDJ70011.1 hypothetical protein, conserved [Eimeria necatrix]